jgi:hypothetical protein
VAYDRGRLLSDCQRHDVLRCRAIAIPLRYAVEGQGWGSGSVFEVRTPSMS